MTSPLEEFDHLKIKLEDIIEATENFSIDRLIGSGGFGPVYKGKITLSTGPAVVAFKRLDPKYGQGNTEFWKEIMMLSDCKHENLISLLGFCIEGDERILVYEYASRGSLDRYLGSSTNLSWNERLKICVGVARALNYLHDPMKTPGEFEFSIETLKAQTSFWIRIGLLKFLILAFQKSVRPTNHERILSQIVLVHLGIGIRCLWKWVSYRKSYSFGVVLFEVMCGKLCYEYPNPKQIHILVPTWKTSYDEKRLEDIICPGLKEQMNKDSLVTFSAIASQCLSRNYKYRPTMAEIVETLEVALGQQRFNPDNNDLVDIAKLAVHCLSYISHQELHSLLSKGILVDNGQSWVSVNNSGRIQEMISAVKCVCIGYGWFVSETANKSRFSNVRAGLCNAFKIKGKTQFLSSIVTYTVYLVFKCDNMNHETHIPFKWKLDNETEYSDSSATLERGDGFLMSRLYQFISYSKDYDFEIDFKLPYSNTSRMFFLEGIEFKPMEQVSWPTRVSLGGFSSEVSSSSSSEGFSLGESGEGFISQDEGDGFEEGILPTWMSLHDSNH